LPDGGYVVECQYESCRSSLRPWNAATNFLTPAFSVKAAVDTGIIAPPLHVLEFGAGNLRNALYVTGKFPDIRYTVIERQEAISRFHGNYVEFKKRGGQLLQEVSDDLVVDVIVCTFVLETICPSSQRLSILLSIKQALGKTGILVASFRGYKGIRGTKYERCPAGEGFVTPLKTFIRGFSVTEVNEFLEDAGFINVETLKKYRVVSPENIHIKAVLGE
jgi:hypothetical protein